MKRFNWPIIAGFLLSFIASLAYPFLLVNYPMTRDFPWVSILLFVVALVLLWMGLKRAFAKTTDATAKPSTLSKIFASSLAFLSIAIIGLFLFGTLVMARWLPPSTGAPKVGQKAPDFSLSDASGKQVSLSELLSQPLAGQTTPPKGVLLIFYRGYW
ncbi:MAG TPA: hypothetical protein VJV03_19485 [Pyrinomonadaceae bacterium]|nr:hypothetical protein [Pyrinomonadaceae bacterium]